MKRIVWKYGLIAGLILAVFSVGMMPFTTNDGVNLEHSELIGYTAMVLAFVMIFVGIRRYREVEGNGSVTFVRAFKVGILITLITSSIYVLSWEVVSNAFMPDFAQKYSEARLSGMADDGATPAALAAERERLEHFQELYRNPFFKVGMTFLEIFPVGLVVTLISAGILRRKPGSDLPDGAAMA